jgi:hypothetical protein
MNSGQEHQWHIELEHILCKVRHAKAWLEDSNQQTVSARQAIYELEPVIEMLEELCEITKGETA